MPKKRTYNFKQIQGSPGTSHSSGGKHDVKDGATVNQKLEGLRKAHGNEALMKKREFAEASSSGRSVPPALGAILGVPETRPPKPKNVARVRLSSRVPGPAAPQSWSRQARNNGPAVRQQAGRTQVRNRPSELFRFARMIGDEAGPHGSQQSLLHIALKVAAENWEFYDSENLLALAELPLRLRMKLLSYLGFYGPTIDLATFRALIESEEPVEFLDLAGLAGHGDFTLKKFIKAAKDVRHKKPLRHNENIVVDSWDSDQTLHFSFVPETPSTRFSQLTHLSLSHPPLGILWQDFLDLSKHLPKLTHLSLAYWKRPTRTPNLATTTVSSAHSPDVAAGGSHYYSAIDHDYAEPASLLRQLASNLLCLEWLDLEGCSEWAPALAVQNQDTENQTDADFEHWLKKSTISIIFVEAWKNLKYLNFSQGWLPTVAGMDALPKQNIRPCLKKIVVDFLASEQDLDNIVLDKDAELAAKNKAELWVQNEAPCVYAGARINACRRMHACKPITIDHGWTRRVV